MLIFLCFISAAELCMNYVYLYCQCRPKISIEMPIQLITIPFIPKLRYCISSCAFHPSILMPLILVLTSNLLQSLFHCSQPARVNLTTSVSMSLCTTWRWQKLWLAGPEAAAAYPAEFIKTHWGKGIQIWVCVQCSWTRFVLKDARTRLCLQAGKEDTWVQGS